MITQADQTPQTWTVSTWSNAFTLITALGHIDVKLQFSALFKKVMAFHEITMGRGRGGGQVSACHPEAIFYILGLHGLRPLEPGASLIRCVTPLKIRDISAS